MTYANTSKEGEEGEEASEKEDEKTGPAKEETEDTCQQRTSKKRKGADGGVVADGLLDAESWLTSDGK